MASGEKTDVTATARGEASSSDTSSSPAHAITDQYRGPEDSDLDQAYWYVHESNDGVEATPHELAALRRKIDWWIVPIMFCCYTMQFIDKVSLNVRVFLLATEQSCIAKPVSTPLSWA